VTESYSLLDDNDGRCEQCNDPKTVEQVQQTYPIKPRGDLQWGTLWLCPLCLAKAKLRDQDKNIPAIASATRGETKPLVLQDAGWRDVAADFLRIGRLSEAVDLIHRHLSDGWLKLVPGDFISFDEQGVSTTLRNDGQVTARIKLVVLHDLRDPITDAIAESRPRYE